MTPRPLPRQGYGAPTARRYPRTLAEAWPAEYADPIERTPRPAPLLDGQPSARSWALNDACIAALLVAIIAAVIFGWLS